jgi:hypothetical protein
MKSKKVPKNRKGPDYQGDVHQQTLIIVAKGSGPIPACFLVLFPLQVVLEVC